MHIFISFLCVRRTLFLAIKLISIRKIFLKIYILRIILKTNTSFIMSSPSGHSTVELKESALDIVDSWLGSANASNSEPTQPTFEKRAQRLGLGAKYVPHKKVGLESAEITF